jgi:hypothetical protein
MVQKFNRITCNLAGAQKRHETFNGQEYLVVPFVSLVEGVHNGSQGPLYYSPEEIARPTHAWNSKPIIVCHPDEEEVTACSPRVLENQQVGTIFNSDFDGRGKGEAWLDEERFGQLAPVQLEAIYQGKAVEVSTGIFNDIDSQPGTWNNKRYDGVVRGILPDHLAILTDEVGACSVADGAGLLVNAAANGSDELSLDDIRSQIGCLMREEETRPAGCDDYGWVCDVYKKYAIYESGGDFWKVGYKTGKNGVSLDGVPEKVRKVTSYVTANKKVVAVPRHQRMFATLNGRILTNEDQQGPLHLPPPHRSEMGDVMAKQQHQEALSKHYASLYSGIQQEGDWGGWVVDLIANYAIYSYNGKMYRLPYTYDDDMIRYDGEPQEVERVSEYHPKQGSAIDGYTSPTANLLHRQEPPAMPNNAPRNQPRTPPRTRPAPAPTPARNAIHQGAHEMVAAHHGGNEGVHPDGQHRSVHEDSETHGSRKEVVNHMIEHGGWAEEDRQMLEDLPDDHFERVSKYAVQGATNVIQPYTYEGYAGAPPVGDRSSVRHGMAGHVTGNAQAQPALDQWLAGAPPELARIVRNSMAQDASRRTRLIKFITTKNARVNPKALERMPTEQLELMVSMAQPEGSPPPTNNYAGQGEVALFVDPQVTQNAGQGGTGDEFEVLPLPALDWTDDKTA